MNCADFTSDPYGRPTWGQVNRDTPSGTPDNTWHTSADIATLVQHFVDTPGNHICLSWVPASGSADRSVWSFDGGTGAKLSIDYTAGSGSLTVTPTPGSGVLLQENFDSYASGGNPVNWVDHDNNLVAGDFFQVQTVGGSQAQTFIGSGFDWHYSHYNGAGATGWSDYEVSGRMNFATASGSGGVTFHSQVPAGQNRWYLLLRYDGEDQFRLYSNGTSISDCTGSMAASITVTPGTWYWYRLQVENSGNRVLIRARVWKEGDPEPSTWPIDCYDAYTSRITTGAVGMWVEGAGGQVSMDDVTVTSLASGASLPRGEDEIQTSHRIFLPLVGRNK